MTSIFDLVQLVTSNIVLYGGTFLLVLSILVFVHEWGHYIVARLCGVKVEIFSIGFGKEIFGWTDKKDTRWKISLIPLGGYVKMFGDTDPASAGHTDQVEEGGKARSFTAKEKEVAFYNKPVWQRALVVAAGPAINFLFAIILLFGLYGFYGQPVTPPAASAVIEGSAAQEAGFKPHDVVVAIDGQKIERFEDIRRTVMVALDTPLEFEVARGDKIVTLTATPQKEELTDRFGFQHSRGKLGIIGPANGIVIDNIVSVDGRSTDGVDAVRKALIPKLGRTFEIELSRGEVTSTLIVNPEKDLNEGLLDETSPDFGVLIVAQQRKDQILKMGLWNSAKASVSETWNITAATLKAIGQIFSGTRSATELGGIIRIGAIAGDMAQAGFIALITFTALLSINLGLINLFPIPMLDGGHLVFYAVEAIKGKPVPDQVQEYAFRFGFVVLIALMLFANLNDVIQLIISGMS
ncbi:MAG: RIP metalloprotease RseP [Pseudomonadota bacterium]